MGLQFTQVYSDDCKKFHHADSSYDRHEDEMRSGMVTAVVHDSIKTRPLKLLALCALLVVVQVYSDSSRAADWWPVLVS